MRLRHAWLLAVATSLEVSKRNPLLQDKLPAQTLNLSGTRVVPKHVICAAIEHTIPERGVKVPGQQMRQVLYAQRRHTSSKQLGPHESLPKIVRAIVIACNSNCNGRNVTVILKVTIINSNSNCNPSNSNSNRSEQS